MLWLGMRCDQEAVERGFGAAQEVVARTSESPRGAAPMHNVFSGPERRISPDPSTLT
jgi:hypothetical protein